MPSSWWELGEWRGYSGNKLATHRITCAFCGESGNWSLEHHAEKKKPNGNKKLNFDTLKCGSCAGYVMILWSGTEIGDGAHDYKVLPWPLKLEKFPKHWPSEVGRFWLQAHRNLRDENWDASAVMARSALQVALRDQKAAGTNLKQEIADLAKKGVLPPLMADWSDNVRILANDAAHPVPGQPAPSPNDAQDIVRFLDFLLEYLYDLPKRIRDYTERKEEGSK